MIPLQHSVISTILCLFIFTSPSSIASDESNMDKLKAYEHHYPQINYSQLRQAMDEKQVFLIDANSRQSYQKGHIPLAKSINDRDILLKQLPVIKSFPIVVYCGGPQCNAWHKAADFATANGYTNVMHFKEGTKGWEEAGDQLHSSLSSS